MEIILSKPTHTDDHVLIEGIPCMHWGRMTDNSFVSSAKLTLNAMGEHISYTYLMGISGAAFRFHFHKDWCPSAADATTGFDVSKVLFQSLGYKVELQKIDDQNFTDIKQLYGKIIDQIERGIPIIAINLKACPEWGIITGYLKKRPGLLCRTYFDEGDSYSIAEHAPWLSYFIHQHKEESMNTQSLFFNSLKMAVQQFKTGYFNEYASGMEAFLLWKNHITQYILKNKEFNRSKVNLSLIHNLIDSRMAAVNYLSEMINQFPIENGLKIVNNYIKELHLLQELHSKELPGFNDNESWTFNILEKQIHALDEIVKLESETIELIEKTSYQDKNLFI